MQQSIEARLDALQAQINTLATETSSAVDNVVVVKNITLSVVTFKDARGIDYAVPFNAEVSVFGTSAGMTSLQTRGYVTLT